ncbi:MAG: LytS/YehU family sensor histidine kinase [Cyclobacteriaceae bacterium]|jgi:LytS/YehU family sensor histidine kinase
MSDRKRELNWRKEVFQIVLIFFVGGFIQELVLDPGDLKTLNSAIKSITINGTFWVMLWKGSQYLVVIIRRSGLSWVDQPLKTFVVAFTAIVTYTITVIFLVLLIYLVPFKGYTFQEFIDVLGIWHFLPALITTLMINTFMHGRAFLLEWKQAAVQVEKFKNESLQAQFESLKNQVNPHFLFNALNALSSLVYDDQRKAVEFIKKLSEVYRYVLDKQGMELVPLDDELAFLKNYVFLQQIRFGENLKLNIDIISNAGMVPPISLQILVENAIKHNVISESKPLHIEIVVQADHCMVKNNIQEKLTKDSTGIGLNNLKERYGFLSKKEVIIEKTIKDFIVKIPVLKTEK